MAPEQGPDSKSKAEKTQRIASDEESVPISDNNQQNTLRSDNIGWIYLLKKEQLVEQCRNVGIITTGFTVDYLRKKLAEMIRTKQLRASSENLLREVENEVKLSENTIVLDEVVIPSIPPTSSRPIVPDTDVMCTVQKWNLRFSGDSDLMEFLERIEELAECYQIHTDRLLPAMLGILSGNALKWYRVKRGDIRCWNEFRTEIQKFFLPKRFLSQIEQNFYTRRQNSRERAKDFILSMLTLARQHPQLRNRDHLDRIYDGLRTEYKHYVRRGDFSSLDDLISMTDEFEALKREEKPQTSHMINATRYQKQHKSAYKRGPFCSHCGRDSSHSTGCNYRDIINSTEANAGYHIPVTIYGSRIHALVDTGSSQTFINEQVAKHLLASGVPCVKSQDVVQMADGSLVDISKSFAVRVAYKQKNISLRASEIPTLTEDLVLGMDFLTACGIELRLEGEVVSATSSSEILPPQSLLSKPSYRPHVLPHNRTIDRIPLLFKSNCCSENNYISKPKMKRKARKSTSPANPRKFIPAPGNRKPAPHRPPPEARPRITQNIQVIPPANSSNPPPLTYIKTIPSQLLFPTKPRPTSTRPPLSSNSIAVRTTANELKLPRPALTASTIPTTPEATSNESGSSTSQLTVSTGAISNDTKASGSTSNLPVAERKVPADKQKAETLLGGITVRQPKTYKRHLQYLVRRPKLPTVQVTVLNRTFARIRCQGRERIVRMMDTEPKQRLHPNLIPSRERSYYPSLTLSGLG